MDIFFCRDWDFFKFGKKSPKSHWKWARISTPENTKKIPVTFGLLASPSGCDEH